MTEENTPVDDSQVYVQESFDPVEIPTNLEAARQTGDFNFDLDYYLSGPMSGILHFNYPEFAMASGALRANGVSINSPHEVEPPPNMADMTEKEVWDFYMAECRKEVSKCKGLIFLAGWHQSKGSRQEFIWMVEDHPDGFPCYFFNTRTMTLTDMNRYDKVADDEQRESGGENPDVRVLPASEEEDSVG